ETRFAQYFAAKNGLDVNQPLDAGDPALDNTLTTSREPFPGAFAGQSINCRSCHFVAEFADRTSGSHRTYSDYARHSPVPDRGDGQKLTARNAQAMVDSTIARDRGLFLHNDGEFVSTAALVRATLTGRNYGWKPDETAQAAHHIANVIRFDNGNGALAKQY